MIFGSYGGGYHPMADYFNAMDSEMYQPGDVPVDIGIGDIGMSVPMGISAANVQGLYSKIRMGTKHIEIGFPGMMGGQRGAQTPEMYGEDQRQAIRELAAINEVKLTTHAAYNVMGLTGLDQGGNTSLERTRQMRAEIERAIDFAADTAGGGPVVVHTGEFERPLTHIYPIIDPNKGIAGHFTDTSGRPLQNYSRDPVTGRLLFQREEGEAVKYKFLLWDDRTGRAYEEVQADRLVAVPVWRRAQKDYEGYDDNGRRVFIRKGDYIDYHDKLVRDPYDMAFERKKYEQPGLVSTQGRVPEYDSVRGRFKTVLMSVEDFEREAEEYNRSFERVMQRKPDYYERATGREMHAKATITTNAGYARGWALQFGERVQKEIDAISKLEKAKDYYEKLERTMAPEDRWKILREDPELRNIIGDIVPAEMKSPAQIIKNRINDMKKSLEYNQQSSISQELQAENYIESMRHLVSPEKYFAKNIAREYAITAVHAMEKTKDPNNPVILSIEHIFPERYGGHPEELKNIIKLVRQKTAELMTTPTIHEGGAGVPIKSRPNPYYKPGVSHHQAEKLAEQHVKATFDTAHLNLWRKYWLNDPKKSGEQNEAEFKKWYLNQVDSLAKEGMIGNVHLTDNFGYVDDHLAPGQGNAPVREAVAIIKKYGYAGTFTVEPGADASTDNSDFHGLMKTWSYFGSPVYGMAASRSSPAQHWGQIQSSYFGQTQFPNYVFGAYAPSNDWTLWTTVPLE